MTEYRATEECVMIGGDGEHFGETHTLQLITDNIKIIGKKNFVD